MSYKLTNDPLGPATTVIRLEDGGQVPFDEGNRDYRDYQAWIAEGNAPEPADPLPDA